MNREDTENSLRDDEVSELRRGTLRLARRLRAERPAGALSANKVLVLAHLRRVGASTPGQIAEAERQRPQSLTRTFTELESAGLITRTRSPNDRRASVLELTPEGLQALAADMADRDAWLTRALADLTDAEVDLLRIAGRLMDRLAGGTR
ncbi:MarR family transcriptional regulator [Solirubrobacter ginsenosidimutans]|uniref:MarR family transcriptional regulator n=1 Tax=Solirubrobacter ginsenosidimutans TaxID=490573 RepID=A0A9X3MMY1_9ACTN|nr:MarR family transcriptional regulator [Solirubrobacter ginsenosidimutans]MDA0159147.1 MarR family transcriptional regulator [Solirubrobacter ginsenosidimutans]